MRNVKFKQANRVLGRGEGMMPIHVNNKKVMISKWKVSFLERLAILIMGTVWVKIDSRTVFHKPQVHHPFAVRPYERRKKRGFTPHGEQL